MQQREKLLLGGLVGTALLWQGGRSIHSNVIEPYNSKVEKLEGQNKALSQKTDEKTALLAARAKLKDWAKRSLPPDSATKPETGSTGRGTSGPTALNAQRLYQAWLNDLAVMCGFEDLKVTPVSGPVISGVGLTVPIKIEGEARYEQVCNFLDRFYRTDLLHRVSSLNVTSRESEGDPVFKVALQVEGVAMYGVQPRSSLFPQTQLEADISADATTITVAASPAFEPDKLKPPFRVRIKNEYITVSEVTKADNGEKLWTVVRGIERTNAADYEMGTIVELAPVPAKLPERSADEFKELVETNVFVKPAPPVQYRLRVSPVGEKTLVRGRPVEFTVVASGYDSSRGRPEFTLAGNPQSGMRIDKSSGRFSWNPADDVKADRYSVKIEIKHPSAPNGMVTENASIVLRDPNSPPQFAQASPTPVYLGREWRFTVDVTDAESRREAIRLRLGSNPPEGLSINDRSGELSWTPGDTIPIGPMVVQINATDDGSPPQTGTLSLELDIRDDVARFTRLVGVFVRDGRATAILFDRSRDVKAELEEGDEFEIGDITGQVVKLGPKYLIFTQGDEAKRLDIGQSLRDAKPTKLAAKPDATTTDKPGSGKTDPESPPAEPSSKEQKDDKDQRDGKDGDQEEPSLEKPSLEKPQ